MLSVGREILPYLATLWRPERFYGDSRGYIGGSYMDGGETTNNEEECDSEF